MHDSLFFVFILFFLYCIHRTCFGAFFAVAAFFLVNAELSLCAYDDRMKRTFHIAGRTANAFFLNYIVCHIVFSLFRLCYLFGLRSLAVLQHTKLDIQLRHAIYKQVL